jgi:ComEC/Rec2-related protein
VLALAAAAVTLRHFPGAAPIAIVALALASGWFLAGTASLRLHHQAALSTPRISSAVTDGGVISGVAAGDSRRGRGSELRVPLLLEEFSAEGGEVVAASGELELRLRGAGRLYRGSAVSARLTAEQAAAVASGARAVTLDAGSLIVSPPGAVAARLRGALRGGVVTAFRRLGQPVGFLAAALILGDRTALDPGLLELMRRAGAMHLLALSGMHLAIVAALLGGMLFPLLGRLGALVATLLLFLYYWVVGPIPSLLRALLMFSLGALLRLRGRGIDPRSLLAAALLIGLLAAPELATGLGWRLSTLALIGILWIGVPLWSRGPVLRPRKLWALLSVSFGAFLLTTPLSLDLFGEAYPASILSSLLLTPLVLLFVWFALLAAPGISLLPFITLPVRRVGELLYRLLEGTSQALARIPPLVRGELIWPLLFAAVMLLLLFPWLRFYLRFLSIRRTGGGSHE